MDADKIKDFCIKHIEKLLFGIVIGAAAFLIYQGLQKPNFLDEEQPDKLTTNATRVKNAIDDDHTDAIIPERVPTFDILAKTNELYTAVEKDPFKPPKIWNGESMSEDTIKRNDPNLIAPVDLRVHSVLGSIAVLGSREDGDYPLGRLEKADEVKKEEPRRERRPRGRARNPQMDMEAMMMAEMGMGDPSMMGDPTMMGDPSMMGPGAAPVSPTRSLSAEFDYGPRPGDVGQRKPKPDIGWFIAGTALVPHKALYRSYEDAFADATGYDPRRDTPIYFNLEVQRADVTEKPVAKLSDKDYSTIWTRLLYTTIAAKYWAGFATEYVPADYRDDALTMWVPPLLISDSAGFALHPRIPMMTKSEIEKIKKEEEARKALEEERKKEAEAIDLNAKAGGLVAPGGAVAPGGGQAMGNMMGEDPSMMGGMFAEGKIEKNPVKYKLIRFYDFAGKSFFKDAPKFGRKYVYRVRYAVNDPNFPASPSYQPKTRWLNDDVSQRVLTLVTEAEKAKKREFERWSDWSEPSDPVSLKSLEQHSLGNVDAGSVYSWSVAGREVEVRRQSPKAKLLSSRFDTEYNIMVPMELSVSEGSVLSRNAASVDVVDPITLNIKKLPDPEYISTATVLDLEGGVPMPITGDEELTEPGAMLIYDATGQLSVNSEVDDLQYFRTFTFADEK